MSNTNLEAWVKEGIYKVGDRCNIKQYKMLLRCSEKKDISEWNNWRRKNPGEEIWLAGADLLCAHLQEANLREANLQSAKLQGTNLQGAMLNGANLQGVDLCYANLQRAELNQAKLQRAKLIMARLQGAYLHQANLQGADFSHANLQHAKLNYARLQGTKFVRAELQDTNCNFAIVDGNTLIDECTINKNTNFTAVGLDSARIDPGLEQLLKYNIRRKRWEEYYKQRHCLRRLLIWLFWLMSDYGKSSRRVVVVFLGLSFIFAGIYWLWPGLLKGVVNGGDGIRGFIHTLYFSVVTMTTLGFGDIRANPGSIPGQILLMFQVLLGYVLLGALITIFAILFTSGGPASLKYFEKSKGRWWHKKRE